MRIRTLFLCPALQVATAALAQTGDAAAPSTQPVASGAALAPASPDLSGFNGAWVWSGDPAEQQARDEAVERVVQQMNVLFRGIARERLSEGAFLPAVYRIDIRGETITIDIGRGRPYTTPFDGTVVPFPAEDNGTKAFTLSRRSDGKRILTSARRGKSVSDSELSLSPDGRTMTVRITITNPQLPDRVQYSLTYRR